MFSFEYFRGHVVSSQSWDNTPPINNNIMDDKVPEKTRRATFSSEGSFQKEDLDNQDDGWSTDELSQTEDEDEDGDIFLQTAEVQYISISSSYSLLSKVILSLMQCGICY